jgi:O-antigen/teichoic acid export membrane protein
MSISGGGDNKRIGDIIEFIIENLLILGCLAVGLCAIFNKDIANILLGPEFREGSVIMPIVLAGVILFNVGTFAHKPFEIAKRTIPMLLVGLGSAAGNIGLNFLLIPRFGYVGAAYATLAAYAFYTYVIGFLGKRLIPWRFYWKRLSPKIAAVAGGLFAIYLIRKGVEPLLTAAGGLVLAIALSGALSIGTILYVKKTSSAITAGGSAAE